MAINFDRVADIYDLTRSLPSPLMDESIRQIIEQCELLPGSRVLELGVGTGRIALPLSKALPLKYVGIDISSKMMAQLRAKSPNTVHLVRGDVCMTPFRAGVFDAVLAVHVFHLIPEWKKALHETRRVLRPEGALIVAGEGGNRLMSLDMLTGELPPEFRARAQEIAERMGMKDRRVGMVGIEEAVDALTQMGASVTLPPMIEHNMMLPLNIIIALLQGRAFSALWDTPQDVLDSCVADLKNLFIECYGNLNARIPLNRTFQMLRAIF